MSVIDLVFYFVLGVNAIVFTLILIDCIREKRLK
jgi:hypothetical protein